MGDSCRTRGRGWSRRQGQEWGAGDRDRMQAVEVGASKPPLGGEKGACITRAEALHTFTNLDRGCDERQGTYTTGAGNLVISTRQEAGAGVRVKGNSGDQVMGNACSSKCKRSKPASTTGRNGRLHHMG